MANPIQLVIITGMSGAGKTVAMQSLEDIGYFCVDNMPPVLFPKFSELVQESGKISKIALVVDLRSRAFYDEIITLIRNLESSAIHTKILFLDASDAALVARYKETRRAHPLAMEGRVLDGIRRERHLLKELKLQAQYCIDTSDLSPRQLRQEIINTFKTNEAVAFHVEVMSFGFKYGMPIDGDIVMDVRFLPNPYYDKKMRTQTGLDQPVYDYVMNNPQTEAFYKKFMDLLENILPGYKKEGKQSLTIAIGCTGGQHRSVALAKRIAQDLSKSYPVRVTHRDIDKHSQKGKDSVK